MAIKRNSYLRKKVLERDQGICAVCKRYDAKWQHDHIIPLSMGGKDTLDNAQTLCRIHHGEKTVSEAPVRAKSDRIKERHELMLSRRKLHLEDTP